MKKVIFDMGNTLIDFHQGMYSDDEKDQIGLEYLSSLLSKKYAKLITVEELNKLFLNKWLGDFYKREELVELDFQLYLNSALKKLGLDPSILEPLECMRAYYTQYMKDAVLNPNVIQIMKQFKQRGITVHVLSNCILSEEVYIEVFKRLNIDDYVDNYTFSYNIGVRKPHESLFLRELESLDLTKDGVYFVGDNINVDILPALKVGMKAIWYNPTKKQGNVTEELQEIADFIDLGKII